GRRGPRIPGNAYIPSRRRWSNREGIVGGIPGNLEDSGGGQEGADVAIREAAVLQSLQAQAAPRRHDSTGSMLSPHGDVSIKNRLSSLLHAESSAWESLVSRQNVQGPPKRAATFRSLDGDTPGQCVRSRAR